MADDSYDMYLQPKISEKRAWRVATIAMMVAGISLLALIIVLPLKETEVFTVMVDRQTGEAEKIVQVEPTNIGDLQAVQESLIVSYITDRESYFRAGIDERLRSVQRRSAAQANTSLERIWNSAAANAEYPPRVLGDGAEVSVKVKTIVFLEDDVAQVRINKTLRKPRTTPIERPFTVVMRFAFEPREERSLTRVWENPLGFVVQDYQIVAETLEN